MHTKKIILSSLICMVACMGFAQTIASKMAAAVQQMEADASLKHAIVSVCVVDVQTGKAVYAHHAQMGLAPASSQKIFTSMAAFELLGKDYRYKTEVTYNSSLQIEGTGDPTLGSWRWPDTKADVVMGKIVAVLKKQGITEVAGIDISNTAFSVQPLPGGWIWDDIGNYYGAGSFPINWRENQYDVHLKAGNKEGDATEVARIEPAFNGVQFDNHITTGKKGSGDNAYIYMPPYSMMAFTQGTIPAGSNDFVISGALPDPAMQFRYELSRAMQQQQVNPDGLERQLPKQVLITFTSPPLDSINYWFMRKSINLYGEALLKTLAVKKTGYGSTDKGVDVLRDFWSERGIEKSALKVVDGSGLSPQNRVTTDAQVKALVYAKTRPWFDTFVNSLPEYNGMKMKSGTIGGAKAFAGYHKNYAFSIIVNNFDGSASAVVQKMYRVLDVLK